MHVGDDLDTDVAGAQACGMKAVWINRAGRELPEGYAPDAELPSLEGLAGARRQARLTGQPRLAAGHLGQAVADERDERLGVGLALGQPRRRPRSRAAAARAAAGTSPRSATGAGAGRTCGPRDGHPAASGQTPQRGVRAMHTSRPRSKSAWFHS